MFSPTSMLAVKSTLPKDLTPKVVSKYPGLIPLPGSKGLSVTIGEFVDATSLEGFDSLQPVVKVKQKSGIKINKYELGLILSTLNIVVSEIW